MELFTENTLLISLLAAVIMVGLVLFTMQSKKIIESSIQLNSFGLAYQILNEIEQVAEFNEIKIKGKKEDVLEQFDEPELIQKIYKLLVLERIYLQQGLMVGEFAKKLGVQTRIVTQIFSELYGHTFKELTNMYRVEYAKERIEEGFLEIYTLEALGQEAGFSSRTTFFNVFKKEIGVCPSEYWKNYLAQAA